MTQRTDEIFGPIREAYRHGNHVEVKQLLRKLLMNSVDPDHVAKAEEVDWENLTTFTIRTQEHGEETFVLRRDDEQS